MKPVPEDIVAAAVDIIGTSGIGDDEIEKRVRALVADDMTARRLVDWIPEAFGLVLVSRIPAKIDLPTTFSVKTRTGKWIELKLTIEPIFTSAHHLAERMFHEGPRETFNNVASLSAIFSSVNKALNAGEKLDGSYLSGPAITSIPAEIYPQPPRSIWQRMFSW